MEKGNLDFFTSLLIYFSISLSVYVCVCIHIYIMLLYNYLYIFNYRKSTFFKHTLKFIQSDPDNVNKVALLLYMEMINAWCDLLSKDVKKRDVVVCPFSEEVNQHIIDTYSVPSTNGR